jgi:hypothetical protein
MHRSLLIFTALGATLLFAPHRPAAAQDTQAPQDTVWWQVSSFQVDGPKLDSLVKLVRVSTLATVTEAKKMGTLLEYRILVRAFGSEYNFQVVRQYRHFADIAADSSLTVAFRRVQPDAARRAAILEYFRTALGEARRRDEIYREIRQ